MVHRNLLLVLLFVLLTACTDKEDRGMISMEEQLFQAAENGSIDDLQKLVEDGVEIDQTNEEGDTAVLIATRGNHVELVKLLIEYGADINIRNHNEDNVLLYAGAEGLLEIVKLAIEANADTTLTNRFGGTALIPAADRGHVEVVDYLLEKSDVDVNHVNHLHWTALLEAVILGDGAEPHQEIVNLLIQHGADIHLADKEGVTPLQHAQEKGYTEIEKMLLEAEK